MGKGPLVVAAVLITVAVIAHGFALAAPGWLKYQENSASKKYSEGLWMRCENDFEACISWLDDILSNVTAAIKTRIVDGKIEKIGYSNADICIWFTLCFGMLMLVIALLFALIGLCCCDGVAKFVILMLGMLAASSILIGDVVYGVRYADEKEIMDEKKWPMFQLYYSFGLSVGAAGLTYIAALVAAFYDSYDK